MLDADNPKGHQIRSGWLGQIDEDGRERNFSTEKEYDEFLEEKYGKKKNSSSEEIGDN